MPGKLKVRVLSARDLPVMDRASETADAFVEVKFSQTAYKTEVYPKSLNPQWMSDWFTFEADDEQLQDDCLQFRVMDYDTYSANDAIGRVYLDLNPLLSKYGSSQIGGWLPIYDTMHGIRGELNVVVKIDLFTDINKFRQSSCGVDVFATPGIPYGYQLTAVHGLVEELLANDDPEYQWIDKIRTPRASNEARQVLFSKMAGQLVRRMGRKVLEMGGNSIIAYRQCFDLEGETGVVARGLGTGVTLEKIAGEHVLGSPSTPDAAAPTSTTGAHLWQMPVAEVEELSAGSDEGALDTSNNASSTTMTRAQPITIERRTVSAAATSSSRDSSSSGGGTTIVADSADNVVVGGQFQTIPLIRTTSHSPGAAVLTGAGSLPKTQPQVSIEPGSATKTPAHYRQSTGPIRVIDHMEYPFFTMQIYPVGFIQNLGSIVCARSVKLLSVIETPDEAEVRHSWWQELRAEIRSHMKAIACNSVVGYREQVSVFKDVCILSATGTAAVVDPSWWMTTATAATSTTVIANESTNQQATFSAPFPSLSQSVSISGQAAPTAGPPVPPPPLATSEKNPSVCGPAGKEKLLNIDIALANRYSNSARTISSSFDGFVCCSPCHIPYSETSLPFPVKLGICGCCGTAYVPNVILTTIDPLAELGANGDFTLVQARVVRRKQDSSGETLANELSDMLPFIEHEIHGQLVSKLIRAGKNAIYGLRTDISLGESHVAVVATGTAVSLAALDTAKSAMIAGRQRYASSSVDTDDGKLATPTPLTTAAAAVVSPLSQIGPSPGASKMRSVSQSAKLSHSDSRSSGIATGFQPPRPPLDLAWDRDAVLAELSEISENDAPSSAKTIVVERLETDFPKGFHSCNTFFLPSVSDWNTSDMRQMQLFVRLYQGPVVEDDEFDTKVLSERINWLVKSTCFKFRKMRPVCLTSVTCDVDFPQSDQYQISFIGMALTSNAESPHLQKISQEQSALGVNQTIWPMPSSSSPYRRQRKSSGGSSTVGLMYTQQSMDDNQPTSTHPPPPIPINRLNSSNLSLDATATGNLDPLSTSCPAGMLTSAMPLRKRRVSAAEETPAIKSRQIFVTPLTTPGHAPICHYLGHYDFFFIRETTSLREAGGLESFTHSALIEVLYVVQAHVAAYGGHGMVAFRFTQIELTHNSNRNQAQCLVAVAGDIVTTLAGVSTV